jgi:hypothetical protein
MQTVPGRVALPADSIRAALHRVFAAREYDWTVRTDPWAWVRQEFVRFADWLDGLRHTHPVAYIVILLGMVTILTVITVHLTWILRRAMRAAVEGAGVAARGTAPHDAAWYRDLARRLGAEGRYREALAQRFQALVLELDQRGAVRFHPSKTPGEYVREARLPDGDRGAFSALVAQLYRHLFGGVPASSDAWNAFDTAAMHIGTGHAAS